MSSSPENASAPPRENPLRLMNLPDGLLINFGAATLKEGLRRIVNNLPTSASPRLRVNPSPP
jgi:iron complex transport system substrate-binding protein